MIPEIVRLFGLVGKTALVTGASAGIGRAIALALASAGANVAVVSRRTAELEVTVQEIEANGGHAAPFSANLADRDELYECARSVTARFGAPDILVSAAGANTRKPMLEVTEEDWDSTLKLNLDAPFFLGQKLAPAMIKRGWGRIINIASLQSLRAFPNSGPYGASKGGLTQLTRSQAQAWSRHGVNANAIAPGFFATDLTAPLVNDADQWKKIADNTFVGRTGNFDDLTGAVLFLASAASNYVTGQTIFVDGGFSAG